MGFWIFMTMCGMLLPVIMVIVGRIFQKNPPKRMNHLYGYRTSRSMQSQEAWDFAQVFLARIWWKTGWIMLVPVIIAMLCVLGRSNNVIGIAGGIVEGVELAVLIASVVPVERALKRKFGK